jgi:hypothetical protein
MVSSHPLAFVAAVFTPTALHKTEAYAYAQMAPIHFCFVVHGHQGRPTDLSYMHETIISKAKEKGSFVHVKSSDWKVGAEATATGNYANKKVRREKRDRLPSPKSSKKKNGVGDNVEDILGSTSIVSPENEQTKGTLIVHNAACNEGKTSDGIIKGGERLVHEILSVIRFEVKRKEDPQLQEEASQQGHTDVTISVIGNSLGGLYGRYAIAHLAEILCEPALQSSEVDEICNYYLLDGCIRIHLNVFCSIASPHLGCADFTYFSIPRGAEIVIAKVMGETGSDL